MFEMTYHLYQQQASTCNQWVYIILKLPESFHSIILNELYLAYFVNYIFDEEVFFSV